MFGNYLSATISQHCKLARTWLANVMVLFMVAILSLGEAKAADTSDSGALASDVSQMEQPTGTAKPEVTKYEVAKPEVTESDAGTMRIVALAPHLVEMLYAIGAGDDIVATVEYANHPEAAKQIPRIGGHQGISIEKLLLLNPDLILFWQGGNQAQDLAKMQELGLNVKALATKRLKDVASTIVQLGQWTGRQKSAQAIADNFTNSLSDIRQQYAPKATLKVFYSLWSQPLMTINKDSWINDLISHCNAENVFADSPTTAPQVSIENVLVTAPDVIAIPDAHSENKQPLDIWQDWQAIPAVAKSQIIHVNGDVMHRFSPNMINGLVDMCQQIDAFRVRG